MATTDFGNIIANDLEQFSMFAGSETTLSYDVYDTDDLLVDITSATCTSLIIKYGDPTNLLLTLIGVLSGSSAFIATLESTDTEDFSGVYQHQPKIVDHLGNTHIAGQGKFVVFPSP